MSAAVVRLGRRVNPGSESWRPGGWAFTQPARIDKAFFDRAGGVSKAEGHGETMEGQTGQLVSQGATGSFTVISGAQDIPRFTRRPSRTTAALTLQTPPANGRYVYSSKGSGGPTVARMTEILSKPCATSRDSSMQGTSYL